MIVLWVLVVVIVGALLAIASAAAGLLASVFRGAQRSGPWITNTGVGRPSTSSYLRAAAAIGGLLALPSSEVVYGNARRDSDGDRLRGDRSYRIVGPAPDAFWWSVTIYSAGGRLDRSTGRWSYSVTELTPDADGTYTIHLSRTPHAGAWIPLGQQRRFTVALRSYLPGPSLRGDGFADAELPRIVRDQ